MIRDEKEFVSALRTLLRERVGDIRYELWFGESTHMACVGQALCVSAPNQFVLEWLQRNFRNDLLECLREIADGKRGLQFQLGDALKDGTRGDSRESAHSTQLATLSTASLAEAASSAQRSRSRANIAPSDPQTSTLPATATSRPAKRFATLDDFVVGESNRTAFKAAELIIEQPGTVSPYFVFGPSSVGKTHLLEGIWSRSRKSGRTAVFLTAEQFTTYFVAALKGGGMPSFRRKYRDVDLLLIDDLQFICGKRRTEEELLYTVDSLARDGRQVILAADRQPAELPGLGPELQTRLQAGLACQMAYPELPEREGLVRRFAKLRSLQLEDDVVRLIAGRIESHARELCGAVNKLFAQQLATSEEINAECVVSTLAESISRPAPKLQLKEIEQAVCQEFQLEPKQLRSSRKTQDVSQPRMLAMWLARKYTRAALSEIGSYFGGRSHSTVVSAQKKVNQWVENGQELQCNSGNWTADEAVRRLESRLRVS